jgi:ferric enterobactin receptor
MKKLLLFIITGFCTAAIAQQTQKTLKKTRIDHFFTCPVDLLLDTLSRDYHLNIVFERDSVNKFDVAEHFFNESLKEVIEKVCRDNQLHYWIEKDGTVYILQNTDDLARLKKLKILTVPHPGQLKRLQ